MKIDIVCVGKVKESFYRDAINEYTKRLSRYADVNIIEVADEKTPDRASETEEKEIRRREGERILKYLKTGSGSQNNSGKAFIITLEINGKEIDSVQLAEKINSLGVDGVSHIQFVIGGSLGLSDEVTKLADYHLSFSKMTFPHQLMRVILLEQIYRSYRIISGEPYHK